jgi:ubiquinone/menaquinone biosynthesis C-methylase UbiE
MREEEYTRLDRLEGTLWWFAGLRALVLALLDRHGVPAEARLLDAGCGTGGMLQVIAARHPAAELHGLDVSPSACALAARKTVAKIRHGSVNAMPYADETFDVVVSLDVLGSDDVDPAAAIAEMRRVLRPDGLLVLSLAAYQWLLSWHDVAVGQSRRFTLGGISELLARHGLARVQASYWNTVLFPLMVLRRKVFVTRDGASDVRPLPPALDTLFRGALAAERTLISRGLRMPWGGSVLVVARRQS